MLEARIDLEFIDYSLVPVEYAWKASAGTIEGARARVDDKTSYAELCKISQRVTGAYVH